jgi:hypothetical protein
MADDVNKIIEKYSIVSAAKKGKNKFYGRDKDARKGITQNGICILYISIMSMSHMMSIPIIYDMDNTTISIKVKIVLCAL